MRFEPLEERALLAVGPQLVVIHPNSLPTDNLINGEVRNRAPSELLFEFSPRQVIDPTTLSSIVVTRSGFDNTFEKASITSDLGTNGAAVITLTATQPGQQGNGLSLVINKAALGGTPVFNPPTITVSGQTVMALLNSSKPSTAQDLITAINNSPAASALFTAALTSGAPTTDVTTLTPPGTTLVLTGANAAKASSNFNTSTQVQFTAATPGVAQNGISLAFTKRNFGGPGGPTVSVTGRTINVELNSNAANPTTAQQLVSAINASTAARALVVASRPVGLGTTNIAGPAVTPFSLVLSGANDIEIQPGYIGIDDNSNEVILRFAETLPDDVYRVEIRGANSRAVAATDFNTNSQVRVQFAAVRTGASQNGIQFNFTKANLGPAAGPVISVTGNVIDVTLNSNGVNPTTAQALVTALNSNTSTNVLIVASILSGNGLTNISNPIITINFSPLTLSGGFGAPVLNAAGDAFNNGVDQAIQFELDLGAQIVAAVPQPIARNGVLTQNRNQVVVYFNNDALNPASAQNPTFYQLIDTATNAILLPQTVVYDQASNKATLTFAADLADTIYQLRVGESAETNNLLATAVKLGSLFSSTNLSTNAYLGDDASSTSSQNFNDVDLYRFSIPGSTMDTVNITVTPTAETGAPMASLDAVLRLFDASGVEIGAATDAGLFGAPETKSSVVLNAGTYFVGVSSKGNAAYMPSDGSGTTFGNSTGSYRLAVNVANAVSANDDNSSFLTSTPLGSLGLAGQSVSAAVTPQAFLNLPAFPGGNDEPGHRHIPVEDHLNEFAAVLGTVADVSPAIPTISYNFQSSYGTVLGQPVLNAITANQKQRAREIFQIYSYYLGVQFQETANSGITVVTGDIRAVDPTLPPTGPAGIAGGSIAVMNALLNFGNSEYGGQWFNIAFHEIGHVLGLGHSYDLPSIQGNGISGEPIFPGDVDLVHGQRLYRPDSTDIDLYQFTLDEAGMFSAETLAERRTIGIGDNVLDSALTLYKETKASAVTDFNTRNLVQMTFTANQTLEAGNGIRLEFSTANLPSSTPTVMVNGRTIQIVLSVQSGAHTTAQDLLTAITNSVPASALITAQITDGIATTDIAAPPINYSPLILSGGGRNVISKNDDYFGKDSFIGLKLDPGTYFIGVSASGNTNYNPKVSDSGAGGKSQGIYNLSLRFTPDARSKLVDATGTAFDGDADGNPGGVFDFWFQGTNTTASTTLFVDKLAPNGGNGSLLTPFNRIDAALSAANAANALLPGSIKIVRIIGNGDVTASPLGVDAYLVGFDDLNNPLEDGGTFEVPRDVTVMIDAGAVLKMQSVIVDVGSSAQGINRSRGALQVLGTPGHNVFFTAYGNDVIGGDDDGLTDGANPGDFGGLVFRDDSDREAQGIFLNYVNQANISFGGGKVTVNSFEERFNPIHLVRARPTVSFNTITRSADAAMSADPNSFEDTLGRIGPDVHGNRVTDNTVNALFVRIRTNLGSPVDRLEVPARFDDTDIVHVLTENLFIVGAAGGPDISGPLLTSQRASQHARLAIDPGIIAKLEGSRIEVQIGGQLIAEGLPDQPIIFTTLRDSRFGAGGTFDTKAGSSSTFIKPGEWGGLLFNATSRGSIDYAFITGAGGGSPIEGGFDNFNAIEIHQAEVRLTNSRLENNGSGESTSTRNGRGSNADATIFVRGAQPVIVNNLLINNREDFDPASGQTTTNNSNAISINANALQARVVSDWGRSTGLVSAFKQFDANYGPLVKANILEQNGTNAMEVRGGEVTTETIWDDTDIVHVVRDEVRTLQHHTFSGVRLQSRSDESLVLKLEGANAGFTADGVPLDINDRIGGTVQVVGTPRFPVVMTALQDCSVGAGFGLDGLPQKDTLGTGACAPGAGGSSLLPTGPEVNNGLLIDNDVAQNIVGHFEITPSAGGRISQSGVTVQGVTQQFTNQDYVFSFANYVDPGSDGNGIDLGTTTITQVPTLVSPDLVRSAGTFAGPNGPIDWIAESFLQNGVATVFNRLTFSSASPFGNVRFVNYLDEDVQGISDDLLTTTGTPGQPDFRALTVDGPELIGFSQGGFYLPGPELVNASYDGWAADRFAQLQTAITGAGTLYTPAGNINTVNLPPGIHPVLGNVNGPADITTAFAWTLSPNATTATVTSFLELVAQGGQTITGGAAGDWRSIRLDRFSNDRNVRVVNEVELPRVGTLDQNRTPANAEFLGTLASGEKTGDDNQPLGFQVQGFINPSDSTDVDVYSFNARAGTEVWLDIDRTGSSLDTVLELIRANGVVEARSIDNNTLTSFAVNALPLVKDARLGGDFYTTNPRDAGMRVILPGTPGTTNTYYVRVRSNPLPVTPISDTDLDSGLTSGEYQLQIRLRQADEKPGSTIRNSDIRFAATAIEVLGLPGHSPLLGEAVETTAVHNTYATAQPLGNLLVSDRNTISVAGDISAADQVDWYQFTVDYDLIQSIGGVNAGGKSFATIFDIDYADGLARADTVISVFDDTGRLILVARDSNVEDDQPLPGQGINVDDLSRGTAGALDPYIGSVQLPAGSVPGGTSRTYYVAISSNQQLPQALDGTFVGTAINPRVRLEPLNTITRVVEDHIGVVGYQTGNMLLASAPVLPTTGPLIDITDEITLSANVVPFTFADVQLYVSSIGSLRSINPSTGGFNYTVGQLAGNDTQDITMRADGQLFSVESINNAGNTSGRLVEIDTGTAAETVIGNDNIPDFNANTMPIDFDELTSDFVDALAFTETQANQQLFYAVRGRHPNLPGAGPTSELFLANATSGAANANNSFRGEIYATTPGDLGITRGMAFVRGTLYGVSDQGDFYRISTGNGRATPIANFGRVFAGLARGPQNVADPNGVKGFYANLLFAITSSGELLSFDVSGTPQAVFNTTTVDEVQRVSVIGAPTAGSTFTLTFRDQFFNTATTAPISANAPASVSINEIQTITIGGGPTGGDFTLNFNGDTSQPIPYNAPAIVGIDEVQTLQIMGGPPTGGSFQLTFAGQQTMPIMFNATAATVQTELVALTNINPGDVSVTGGALPGGTQTITFGGQYSGVNVMQITVSNNSLVGGGTPVTATMNDGVPSVRQLLEAMPLINVGDVLVSGGPFPGSPISVQFVGQYAGDDAPNMTLVMNNLNMGATVSFAVTQQGTASIQSRLEQLALINVGDVIVTGGPLPGTPVSVQFTGQYAGINLPFMLVNNGGMGGGSMAFVTTIQNGTGGGGGAATSVFTGVPATGLAFSPLDFNLWHPTLRRSSDVGHGTNAAFDNSRDPTIASTFSAGSISASFTQNLGGASLYFGLEQFNQAQTFTNYIGYESFRGQLGVLTSLYQQDLTSNPNIGDNYNLPGGAFGRLVTNAFSLQGYSKTDKPTLYFNYFLETEDASGNKTTAMMRDSARVFMSIDGGLTYQLLTTNNSVKSSAAMPGDQELPAYVTPSRDAYLAAPNQAVQELFDNTNGWRQARVDLADFAGQPNLILRFDFNTSGRSKERTLPGDAFALGNPGNLQAQNNDFEGFYIDDIIVGFAERGEVVTAAPQDQRTHFALPTNPTFGAPMESLVGPYQLEVRRGTEAVISLLGEVGNPLSALLPDTLLLQQFDTNDRLAGGFTILAVDGALVSDTQTFTISDGIRVVTFEFDNDGMVTSPNIPVTFTAAPVPTTPQQMALNIQTAINQTARAAFPTFAVTAVVGSTSDRVDLVNAVDVAGGSSTIGITQYNRLGDSNLLREQGHLQIEANRIRDVSGIGILVDAGARDAGTNLPHAAPVRNLPTLNNARLAPGVKLFNNVIGGFGTAGIRFSGDPNTGTVPLASVPFGRIVNNTVYGGTTATGVGIQVTENASPTILNNIIANTVTGISVDATSSSTVVGVNLFQGNTNNGVTGSNAILLAQTDPLFVNPANGNFYLARGSRAIDSSLNTLADRPNIVAVKSPLGIPQSSIVAPNRDLFGQLRVDDPNQAPPPGLGTNIFIDRGGIERADFLAPSAALRLPPDNGPGDLDATPTRAVFNQPFLLTRFVVALLDAGIGIDDTVIVSTQFELLQNGVLLTQNVDYFFDYNDNTDEAIFTSSTGVWPLDTIFTIRLDNTPTAGIKDLAGNPIAPNQVNGTTSFTVVLTDGVNDPPVNLINGVSDFATQPQTTLEDTPVVFSAANGNQVVVTDSDAFLGTNGIQVTLTASNGRLTLSQITGLTFVDATGMPEVNPNNDGTNDALLRFRGSPADINAALDGLMFTPNPDFNGPTSVVIETNDLGEFTAPPAPAEMDVDTISITVNPVNDPPTLNAIGDLMIDEDAPQQTVNLSGISAGPSETQTLTVTASSNNTALISNPTVTYTSPDTTGTLLFTPVADQFGTAVITVTVMDNGGTANGGVDMSSRTFTVTVNPINDAPTLSAIANVTVNEDAPQQTVNLTGITAGPNETQMLTVTATSNNPALIPSPTVTYSSPAATGTLAFTPAANQSGMAVITVTIMDNGGTANGGVDTFMRTFTVTVDPVNDAPTLNAIANSMIDEDAPQQTVNLSGISAGPNETQILTVTASSSDTSLIPNPTVSYTSPNATGTLNFTPAADRFGTAVITVTVMDNGGTTNGGVDMTSRTFTVTVNPINDAPTIDAIADVMVDEDVPQQTVNLTGITAGPNETQVLTVTATSSNPALIPNPTITYTSPAANGTLAFTPAANQTGMAVITVTVTDNGGTANGGVNMITQSFTVTVDPVNDAPTLNAIANPAVNEDAPQQTINLSGISAGPNESQVLTVTASSNDTLLIPNPTVTYTSPNATGTLNFTPAADRFGTAVITVTVMDNGGTANGGVNTFSRTFTVTVNPVNDAPTLDPIATVTVSEDASPQTVDLTGITAGPNESQVLTVTASSNNPALIPNPTITYTSPAANGSLTFTPVANQTGTAVITVAISDNGGTANGGVSTITRTFTVNVNAVNDPPENRIDGATDFSTKPQNTVQGSSILFSTTNNNLLTISDVDVDEGTGQVQVTVTANNGTVTLGQTTGLTFVDAGGTPETNPNNDGTSDAVNRFRGTLAAVNAALAGMRFRSTASFTGDTTVVIATNDLGNFPAPAATTTSTIDVAVAPNPFPWQNPNTAFDNRFRFDVNKDGVVNRQDVIVLIGQFRNGVQYQGGQLPGGPQPLPVPPPGMPIFCVDVTGDNAITALDVFSLISFLRSLPGGSIMLPPPPSGEGEGEGEAAASSHRGSAEGEGTFTLTVASSTVQPMTAPGSSQAQVSPASSPISPLTSAFQLVAQVQPSPSLNAALPGQQPSLRAKAPTPAVLNIPAAETDASLFTELNFASPHLEDALADIASEIAETWQADAANELSESLLFALTGELE